jgi:hypothetical protein
MKMNWVIKATLGIGAIVGMVAGSACSSTSGGTGAGGSAATCSADSDCATGEFCDPNTAVCTTADSTACTASSCAADETCDTTSGYCTYAGCQADTDCLAGETCDTSNGTCGGTPTTAPGCKQCACVDLLSAGGCANVCDDAQNGTSTPNFCNGTNALPQCAKCLMDNCSGASTPPVATDPSACM